MHLLVLFAVDCLVAGGLIIVLGDACLVGGPAVFVLL